VQSKRSEKEVVVTLRLPRELHEQLKNEAGDRGFAAEVRRRLQASLLADQADEDQATNDLLAVIRYAAASIGKLGVRRAWHEEIVSFKEFKVAVNTLIDAFQPKGETPQGEYPQIGGAMLVGMALGALGERGVPLMANLQSRLRLAQESKP
jgi:hypothetical protein